MLRGSKERDDAGRTRRVESTVLVLLPVRSLLLSIPGGKPGIEVKHYMRKQTDAKGRTLGFPSFSLVLPALVLPSRSFSSEINADEIVLNDVNYMWKSAQMTHWMRERNTNESGSKANERMKRVVKIEKETNRK